MADILKVPTVEETYIVRPLYDDVSAFDSPIQTRLKMLDRAEALLSEYLNTCEQLSLLEEIDRLAWQSMLKSGGKSTTGRGQAMSREQKIERFR